MKLGKIILKLRLANTHFGSFIGGAAELNVAVKHTLLQEMAFVIPLLDDCAANENESGINQKIIERFGVVVAIRNDKDFADKTGLGAYDSLYEIRSQLFRALLGWQIIEAESLIYYRGGKLVMFNGAYLYYQFEFEYNSRIVSLDTEKRVYDIQTSTIDEDETEEAQLFEKIYTYTILSPSERLERTEGEIKLPLTDLFPDFAQAIDMSSDPGTGSFNNAFRSGFKVYDSEFTR